MKKIVALVTLLTLNGMPAVYALNAPPIAQEFVLKPGQTIAIKQTNIKIQFDSVLNDSRCPIEVRCVWSGNAEVKLMLQRSSKQKAKPTSAIVNTVNANRSIDYLGYRIQLLKLNPGRQQGKVMPQTQYEATFRVSRIQ